MSTRLKRTRPSSETSPCRKHAPPAEHARRDRLGRRQLQVAIGCSKQCTHPWTSIGRHWPDIIVRPGVRVRRDSLLVEESAPSHGSTLTCRGSSDHPEAQIHSRQISGRACGYAGPAAANPARQPISEPGLRRKPHRFHFQEVPLRVLADMPDHRVRPDRSRALHLRDT
jgi:hypothetical protein